MNKPFIILFTIGAMLVMGFSIYKSVQAEGVYNLMPLAAPPAVYAESISDSLAYEMFMDYHQSSNPENSKGVLRTGDEAIVQFYIDRAQLISPLESKAASLGLDFIGLSAIPAYNDVDRSHTLIWVAVVDADTSAAVVPKLMLPSANETWTDYIYDHIVECPDFCAENSDWLWNKEWTE